MSHRSSSKRISTNLKKLRLQKGLTQMEVSVSTNLDRSYIGKIEAGKARVTLGLLERLCKGLMIHSSELIGNDYFD